MSLLESDLKNEAVSKGSPRFVTSWFNPWKFNSEEQVWAAFLDKIVNCLQDSMSLKEQAVFAGKRSWNNFLSRFDLSMLMKLVLLIIVGIIFFWAGFTQEGLSVCFMLVKEFLGESIYNAMLYSWIGVLIPFLSGFLLLQQLHQRVVKHFNLDLLEYLKDTDFRDKIGTLAQFEKEMDELNKCIPDNSKVVIFLDDLDRCKPNILWEIIEALQLLNVSKKCIFILGMDMRIVVRTINKYYRDMNPDVRFAESEDGQTFQHCRAYQFLEKIIQTRTSP